MIRLKIPNLLRLYLNPFVVQTCVALAEMVSEVWSEARREGRRSSFLANSGDEALSGALKLARYTQNRRSRNEGAGSKNRTCSHRVWLVDDGHHFRHFADTTIEPAESGSRNGLTAVTDIVEPIRIVFLPEMISLSTEEFVAQMREGEISAGILVLSPQALRAARGSKELQQAIFQFSGSDQRLWIACLDRNLFTGNSVMPETGPVPDIVIFDETFTGREVPFGAFTARRELAVQWTVKGMTNFHSTTFQPNTVSTLHFLKCLQEYSRAFFMRLQIEFKPLLVDHDRLYDTFRDLFSASLARLITLAGYHKEDVTAAGHYIRVGSRRVFDGVGGVACSLRGHNPSNWVREITDLDEVQNLRLEVEQRLFNLTGLPHHVPGVSGAAAAEHAVKLALAAQPSRSLIVAFDGGFGGKTLLALSGTAKSCYRTNLDPLYGNVRYLDPFAADAASQLQQVSAEAQISLIQLELIQGVGGVREIPHALLECIQEIRRRTGALLFVDEIQTGMFRTGPFVRSTQKSIQPDLLTIGKGVSDMMFPFALTLYTDSLESRLKSNRSTLAADLRNKYSFELGYRTLLNTLRRAEHDDVSQRVRTRGQQFRDELARQLKGLSLVRDVRCFGLLIGIELNCRNTLIQRVGLNSAQLYLLKMMNHAHLPVLMGFCQYEPNILKFTPPLSVDENEVTAVCRTIADTLRASTVSLLLTALTAFRSSKK